MLLQTTTHHVVLLEAHPVVEAIAVTLRHVAVGLLVEAAPAVVKVPSAVVATAGAVLAAPQVVVPSSLVQPQKKNKNKEKYYGV